MLFFYPSVGFTERGNVARDDAWMTSQRGVFACGDLARGQSLIVWAIAEGRSCAAWADRWLMGETLLPEVVKLSSAPSANQARFS